MQTKPRSPIFLLVPGLLIGCGFQQDQVLDNPPPTAAAQPNVTVDRATIDGEAADPSEGKSAAGPATAESEASITLLAAASLDGWEVTNFGGEGECRVEEGKLIIESGYPLSGVTSTRTDLPLTNYEIALEVQRTGGVDFFCGLTFPVADSHCSFIVGGWAGSVVGLSCIDGADASHNETRKLMKFEPNRWYKIRVRVIPDRISAWIDDEQVVDQNIAGREISVRNETLPSRPLGICNFETTSEFRNIKLTRLAVEK